MDFRLHSAKSADHALEIAAGLKEGWRYVAGGTDLVIQLRRGVRKSDDLIDLSSIASMRGIKEDESGFQLGALCTHKDIELHEGLSAAYPALVAAARVVGGHQIRNVGTVGGNLANASPAADVAVALLALDALIDAKGRNGSREIKIDDLFVSSSKTTLAPGELIERVRLPRLTGETHSAFLKVGRRKAMEISVVSAAICLAFGANGVCEKARIALGAVGPRPLRAKAAERLLEGAKIDAELIARVAAQARAECTPRSDPRASAAYRSQVVEGLVKRGISQCVRIS